MPRRGERDRGKERFWRRLVRQWQRSGLTVRAFCELHRLAEPSFYFWRRTIADRDPPPAARRRDDPVAPLFVPVCVSSSASALEIVDYIGDADHPGVVFDYTATHARDGPAAFLKEFAGYLQADAYSVYDGIYTGSNGAIIEVACWAHARNKFKEAQSTDPERALAVKAWVRKLYDVEDEATAEIDRDKLAGAAAAAVRLRLRQEKSLPMLTSLCQWLLAQKDQVLPKSPIAAAINYALNQWDALQRYTTDGDLDIDNNISERTLKLIGIGRVNWLFLGSDAGGTTAAVLFSFTATCKHLGIDSFAYLRDVLERLPTHPPERLDELLPHRWQAARLAAPPELPATVDAANSPRSNG